MPQHWPVSAPADAACRWGKWSRAAACCHTCSSTAPRKSQSGRGPCSRGAGQSSAPQLAIRKRSLQGVGPLLRTSSWYRSLLPRLQLAPNLTVLAPCSGTVPHSARVCSDCVWVPGRAGGLLNPGAQGHTCARPLWRRLGGAGQQADQVSNWSSLWGLPAVRKEYLAVRRAFRELRAQSPADTSHLRSELARTTCETLNILLVAAGESELRPARGSRRSTPGRPASVAASGLCSLQLPPLVHLLLPLPTLRMILEMRGHGLHSVACHLRLLLPPDVCTPTSPLAPPSLPHLHPTNPTSPNNP